MGKNNEILSLNGEFDDYFWKINNICIFSEKNCNFIMYEGPLNDLLMNANILRSWQDGCKLCKKLMNILFNKLGAQCDPT